MQQTPLNKRRHVVGFIGVESTKLVKLGTTTHSVTSAEIYQESTELDLASGKTMYSGKQSNFMDSYNPLSARGSKQENVDFPSINDSHLRSCLSP